MILVLGRQMTPLVTQRAPGSRERPLPQGGQLLRNNIQTDLSLPPPLLYMHTEYINMGTQSQAHVFVNVPKETTALLFCKFSQSIFVNPLNARKQVKLIQCMVSGRMREKM